MTPEEKTKLAPYIGKARYAKGKMAVHCPSDGTCYRTYAMTLCSQQAGRYSGREKAYIMSPRAAERVRAAYAEWAAKDA